MSLTMVCAQLPAFAADEYTTHADWNFEEVLPTVVCDELPVLAAQAYTTHADMDFETGYEGYMTVDGTNALISDEQAGVYGIGNALRVNSNTSAATYQYSESFTPINTGNNKSFPATAHGENAYVEASVDVYVGDLSSVTDHYVRIDIGGYENTTWRQITSLFFRDNYGTYKDAAYGVLTVGHYNTYDNSGAAVNDKYDRICDITGNTWYNIRIVAQLAKDGENVGEFKAFYVNGVDMIDKLTVTKRISCTSRSSFKQVDRLSVFNKKTTSSTVAPYVLVDNFKAATYDSANGASPIVDKYALISAIRTAEANGKTDSDANLANAKSVCENKDATQAEVDAACEKLLSNVELALSEDFEGSTHKLGSITTGDNSDGSNVTSASDGTFAINKALKIGAIKDSSKEYATKVHTSDSFSGGYLSDSTAAQNGTNAYAELSFDALVSGVNEIPDYYMDFSLGNMKSGTFRESATIRFHQSKNDTDNGIKYWMPDKGAGTGGVTETDTALIRTLTDYSQRTWYNIRLKIHLTDASGSAVKLVEGIYVNGENVLPGNEPLRLRTNANITELNSIMLRVKGYYKKDVDQPYMMVDNIRYEKYNLPSQPVRDGALIGKIREIEYAKAHNDYSQAQLVTIDKAIDAAKAVLSSASCTQESVDSALANINASLPVYTGIPVYIPGTGELQKNTAVRLALHYGEQEGIEAYDEIFLNGKCLPDFSDVYFTDSKDETLEHEIVSSGNYDMIRDDSMTGSIYVSTLSDGTIVAVRGRKNYANLGTLSLSEDNGKTWRDIESTAGKAERLSFVDKDDNIYYCQNTVGVYKLYAADNYQTSKMVLDYNNLPGGVTLDTNPADKIVVTGTPQMAQTDDGYMYISHYQGEHCARLYGSDNGGESFELIYSHPDAQHCHTIRVNRNVTPNEVYVAFDWAAGKPVSLVSNDHFETYTQIDVPYRNSDFNLGFFGDGFSYFNNPDGGYALGGGEANILGGPSVYKTTDAQNPDSYRGVIETLASIRAFATPDNGKTIVTGLLGGQSQNVDMICASYDKGETWETIYAEEPNYNENAGTGVGKQFTGLFTPKGSDEPQIIASGDSRSYNLRMKFGDKYKYALCYVKTDIPANGKTIYLNVGGGSASDGEYSVLSASKKADKTISSVRVAQLESGRNAVLINAVYDADGKLIGTKAANLTGDGNYDLETEAENAASSRLFLWNSLSEMLPLKLSNNPLENSSKTIMNSNESMFTDNLKLRLKLDEGEGSAVKDSVSGKTFSIEGGGQIWAENAQIRYGAILPLKERSSTALKLNKTAYINLGNVEGLDFSKDMTFVFWSNPETKRGYGVEWNLPGDKNYTHKQVLFKSDDVTIYQQKNYLYFRTSEEEMFVPLQWAASNANYYNLNYVTYYAPVTNTDGSVTPAHFEVFANDQINPNQNKQVTIDLNTKSLSSGNLYLGTPNASETEYSMWFGLADVMIYDRALTPTERRAIYYGTNMTEATIARQ